MNLFIDADSCPVMDLAIKICKQYGTAVTLISDTSHQIEKEGAKSITVEKGEHCADFKIINLVASGDVVLTQDYGLAAMALAKKAYALNQNGVIYTNENIDSLLFSKHIHQKMRSSGVRVKGPQKRSLDDDKAFSKALHEILSGITRHSF